MVLSEPFCWRNGVLGLWLAVLAFGFPVCVSAVTLSERPGDVVIEVADEPLQGVLSEISRGAGIQFQIGEGLGEVRLTRVVRERDWSRAVRALLENFNTLETADAGGRLQRVWVLGYADASPAASRGESKEPPRAPDHPDVEHLKLLSQYPPGVPLPEPVFQDPRTKTYLAANGIESPQDWRDPVKAKRLRRKATRLLNRLTLEQGGK